MEIEQPSDDKPPERYSTLSRLNGAIKSFREHKNSVLLLIAMAVFTDMFAYGVIIPLLPTVVKQVGPVTDQRTALLFTAYSIGSFVFTPVFGITSDRLCNRRGPLLIGQAGMAICAILFCISYSYPLLVVARFIQGASAAATWVVGQALLTDVFFGENLAVALSVAFCTSTPGYFIGSFAGGLMPEESIMSTSFLTPRLPFFICLGLALLNFAFQLWVRPQNGRPTMAAEQALAAGHLKKSAVNSDPESIIATSKISPASSNISVASSIHSASDVSIWTLLWMPECLLINCVVILTSSSFSVIEAFISDYLKTTFGLNSLHVVFCMMAFYLPDIVLSTTLAGYLAGRVTRYKLMAGGLVFFALSSPLITSAPKLWMFVLGSAYYSATWSFVITPIMPELATIVDRMGGSLFARVYTLYNMSANLGTIIGPNLIGIMKPLFSFFWAQVSISAFTIVYAAIFYYAMKRLQKPAVSATTLSITSSTNSDVANIVEANLLQKL